MADYLECCCCHAPAKRIFRKLSLTTGDGELLDRSQWCEDCWRGCGRKILMDTYMCDSFHYRDKPWAR